jgi:RHS repeat-associated protein
MDHIRFGDPQGFTTLPYVLAWVNMANGYKIGVQKRGRVAHLWIHRGSWEWVAAIDDQRNSMGTSGQQCRLAMEITGSETRAEDFGSGEAITPPPLEQSFGTCGVGVHAYSRSVCRKGVNTLTGSYTTRAVDLSMPGLGIPFTLIRTYTSSDADFTSVLGRGWTHSFASSLTEVTPPPVQKSGARVLQTGDIELRGDDGQHLLYERQPDGVSFLSPSGGLSLLSAVPGGYELLRHDHSTYRYDSTGQKLVWMRDRNGRGLSFTYVGSELDRITDSAGRIVDLDYVGGRLTKVTLPDGRYVAYGYSPSGLLESVRDARGFTTLYGYDGAGRLASITDQRTNRILLNTYDSASGRVSEQLDANDKLTRFAWDDATQTSTMTDARNKQWKDVYAGRLLKERLNPLQEKTQFEYDLDLNVRKVTDPRGNVTTMEYDARHNLRKRTAAAPFSYVEEWAYTTQNDVDTYKDGRLQVTDYDYTAGNLTSVKEPDPDGPGPLGNPTWAYGRDPAGTGLLKSIRDPLGKTTAFDHYPDGNVRTITTQLGHITTLCYDGSGRLIGRVDPRGTQNCDPANNHRWSYEYNENDQLRKVTDPLGNTTQLAYDPAGNLETRTDARTNLTRWTYEKANRLDTVTVPDPDPSDGVPAPVARYEYDAVGNLSKVIDAKLPAGRQTLYEYDDANRLRMTTAPLNRIWTYGYDPNGNLETVVDANGNFTTGDPNDGKTIYGYDELNRLRSITYSDATPDVTFAYDANDNRKQMADGSGTETYDYDFLNRLTTVTRGSSVFSYAYDLLNLTGRTYPGGTSTTYLYDDDERLRRATSGSLQTNYTYDAAANLQTTTLPAANGYLETRDYDRAGRLTLVEHTKGPSILSKFVIDPDPVGNPRSVVRTGTSLTQTQTYQYDNLDRLKGVCFQAGSPPCPAGADPYIRWTYDEVGNRLTETRTGNVTTSYAYNDADELTQTSSSAGTTAFLYDKNGNQTQKGSRLFTYDLANRLKTTTLGNSTATYSYDGEGKRLQTSTGNGANAKTNFLWDVSHALPQLALERNGNDALQRQYLYGLQRIRQTVGTASYYHSDGLGSVSNLTSDTGASQRALSYEPFGQVRTNTGSGPSTFLKFTGEYEDPTGLYHLRARQYDPSIGRFLTRDPAGVGHSYAYADNMPTVFGDPSGLVFGPLGDWLRGHSRERELVSSVTEKAGSAVAAHGHTALDVGGLAPFLGEVFDLINCGWYGVEGDELNAGLSCGSAIPFAGYATTSVKFGRKFNSALVAAKEAPAIVRGGETAATRYGREIHKTFDYGAGFRREFTLPSGRRADAVNLRTREVVELKPNNPRAMAQGRHQLEAYARELEELYPGAPFTRRLETYDRP